MRAILVTTRLLVILIATLTIDIATARYTMATEAAITMYGERNSQAPEELKLFSFLVGKWNGAGKTRLADGSHVQWQGATWIGRYVLDGMAIADEVTGPTPDGKTGLGISLRQFDTKQNSWIIEFLNVSNSFIRRQVNPRSGSVSLDAGTVVIIFENGQTSGRERYRVTDQNHFTYSLDTSRDGGRSWDPVLVEMTMTRAD
jgi:hypothetical protein